MQKQPEISTSSLALSPAPLPGPGDEFVPGPNPRLSPEGLGSAQPGHHPPQRIPHWLIQVELLLRVILRLCLGLILFCAPWWDDLRPFWEKSVLFELYPALAALPLKLWIENPLFASVPALGALAVNGAVRGVISGLGLLNLWFALQDAIRHREA